MDLWTRRVFMIYSILIASQFVGTNEVSLVGYLRGTHVKIAIIEVHSKKLFSKLE